jgi:hypothetical protein
MIVGQEVMEELGHLSVEDQPTKAVLADMYECIFHLLSV